MPRWLAEPINPEVLEAMMQYGATAMECAGRFKCHDDTIRNYVKTHYDMTYSELSEKLMHTVKMKLRQKLYDSAMDGNTAIMIWLSKQWLAMKEQGEIEHNLKDKIEIVIK